MSKALREDVTATALLRRMGEIAAGIPVPVAVSALVSIGLGIAIDLLTPSLELANGLNFVTSLVQIGLQLWIVIAALDHFGADRRGGARFFGLFLLSIPLTIGIGVGLLLLIVPGIYLAARWRIAVPLLIARNGTASGALRESWQRTADCWRPLMIATTIVGLPLILSLVAYLAMDEVDGNLATVLAIVANLLLYPSLIAGWLLDLAAYRMLGDTRDALAETFA